MLIFGKGYSSPLSPHPNVAHLVSEFIENRTYNLFTLYVFLYLVKKISRSRCKPLRAIERRKKKNMQI